MNNSEKDQKAKRRKAARLAKLFKKTLPPPPELSDVEEDEEADRVAQFEYEPDEPEMRVRGDPPLLKNQSVWRKYHLTVGGERLYASAQQLWEDAMGYFEWMEEHPLYETKATHYQGEQVDLKQTKMRMMTLTSLHIYLGISSATWYNYKTRKEFSFVMERIEGVIYTQKIEAAAADMMNSNLVIREVGLKERTDVTSGDEPVTGIIRTIIGDAEERKDGG